MTNNNDTCNIDVSSSEDTGPILTVDNPEYGKPYEKFFRGDYDIKEEARSIICRYYGHIGNELYFITITLPPRLYKHKATTQFAETINTLRTTFEPCVTVCELTDAGNVHYHVIKAMNRMTKFKLIEKVKSKRCFGYMHINKVPICSHDMLDKAANYMCKDLNTTRKIIESPNNGNVIIHFD